MLLAIFFINVWGVLQLVALGSFARTVRVRTVLSGIAVGLFFCAPFAGLLEHTWTAAIAALTGRNVTAVIAVTGYTVDPPVEEIVRILPLALLLMVPVIRRQLSVTDCVLIGAAAGAGFGLAEDLYRFGTAAQHATAVAGGWVAPYSAPIVASASQRVFIPSIATALGGWLPDTGGLGFFGMSAYMLPNVLLIWSSLAGLAVGLWLRLEGPRRWFIAAAVFAYAASAHAAHNADLTLGRQLLVTAPFRALANVEPLMPIAALAIAWWIDRRRQRDVLPEHLLAAEQSASPRALGTWRAGMARLPESIFWVSRFVRMRRAFNIERVPGGPEAEPLRVAIDGVRNQIDHELQQPGSWRATAARWTDETQRVLRQPATIVWIVLTLPSTLWFVVGGWPATAGVQRLLSDGAGWGLAVGLTVAAYAWMAWRILSSLPLWRRLRHIPIGDPGAALVLGFVGGTGALGFGAFGVWRAFSPGMAAGVAHLIDALLSLLAPLYPPLANLGPALWNLLFKPSPHDIHIPTPDGRYFTPTGVRRRLFNNMVDKVLDSRHDLDPSGFSKHMEEQGAYPDVDRDPFKMKGSGDPNDASEAVGDLFFRSLEYVFRSGVAVGAYGQGSRGGVNPAGRPQPAPSTGGVNPYGKTIPAPPRGVDPYAKTMRGVDPHGKTMPAPPPNVSPKATTISPSAKTIPPQGSVPFGSADTQPAPVVKPSDTARIDDP